MTHSFPSIISNADLVGAVAYGGATVIGFEPVDGYPNLVDVTYSRRPFADAGDVVSVMRTSRKTARKLGLAA